MKKHMPKRKPKPCSVPYYIEEVVGYGTKYKTGDGFKDGYPPVVAELLLSIYISVLAIRHAFCLVSGALLFLLIKMIIVA